LNSNKSNKEESEFKRKVDLLDKEENIENSYFFNKDQSNPIYEEKRVEDDWTLIKT